MLGWVGFYSFLPRSWVLLLVGGGYDFLVFLDVFLRVLDGGLVVWSW